MGRARQDRNRWVPVAQRHAGSRYFPALPPADARPGNPRLDRRLTTEFFSPSVRPRKRTRTLVSTVSLLIVNGLTIKPRCRDYILQVIQTEGEGKRALTLVSAVSRRRWLKCNIGCDWSEGSFTGAHCGDNECLLLKEMAAGSEGLRRKRLLENEQGLPCICATTHIGLLCSMQAAILLIFAARRGRRRDRRDQA